MLVALVKGLISVSSKLAKRLVLVLEMDYTLKQVCQSWKIFLWETSHKIYLVTVYLDGLPL